jgi:hypothetical protein
MTEKFLSSSFSWLFIFASLEGAPHPNKMALANIAYTKALPANKILFLDSISISIFVYLL